MIVECSYSNAYGSRVIYKLKFCSNTERVIGFLHVADGTALAWDDGIEVEFRVSTAQYLVGIGMR